MSKPDIVMCAPVRTPIGAYDGALKDTPATDLGAAVVRETLRRAALSPTLIDGVVLGQVVRAGAEMNPARQATIGAGLPVTVPALTVNRVCGSGGLAVASAVLEIIAGQACAVIASGHGEHGPSALSGSWRALGKSHGRCGDVRQRAA